MYLVYKCNFSVPERDRTRQYLQSDYSFGAKETALQITTRKLAEQIAGSMDGKDRRAEFFHGTERIVG